ncbi:Uncharacterised protein [Chryseobacterium gleum]|uniref:DUF4822 domain-containing protein n=2 Tax=Chryseobacterium gleum TaxID=250 RepID=A0A3S4M3B8_CHRGE|nr:DUF4822 domain-containing protein [Chryseobacterium gleum]EFK37018.1 hypothetical protein HMPREF0204_10864 [Chryseobacterium gleum ATCC 35910]QQY32288.1 DUF4822 domain-containing protein [Chryseobacterium gleum]VEE10507.1 Uncharacterised protein [Chryseobacterium gleum]
MNTLKKLCYLSAAVLLTASFVSCSSDDNEISIEQQTPSQVLSSTPWETTGAKDNNGKNVALTDANVAGYVGFAYFKANGNFAIYGLNDVLRSMGTWSVDPQGKTRTINLLNPDGTTILTRDVEILVLNRNEFTYRIHPNAADLSVYYDIIHTRTAHTEPSNGQLTLASTPWETTGAKDKDGNNVPLDNNNVAGYVGYSYFKANGTFKIFGLNDVLRSEGTWSISPDGKKRTLTTPTFTRVVDILVLNETTFTYRITDTTNPAVFYDIIHTKVNHKEPL